MRTIPGMPETQRPLEAEITISDPNLNLSLNEIYKDAMGNIRGVVFYNAGKLVSLSGEVLENIAEIKVTFKVLKKEQLHGQEEAATS